jgi:hypothetical protein
MSRKHRSHWQALRAGSCRTTQPSHLPYGNSRQRRLRLELLEDRRLLAVVMVNTLSDTVDFNDGVTSLREAIFATNLVAGADMINFAASLTSGGPATILLTQGELKISDELTIMGPGADLLTIDASGNDPTPDSTYEDGGYSIHGDGSRVFSIDDSDSLVDRPVTILGLTLTGGDVSYDGGAILANETLTVASCTIAGNWGELGGGGISAEGNVTVASSTIAGNSAESGGGIHARCGDVMVTSSTIAENSASLRGGGIEAGSNVEACGNVTVTASTIAGNSTHWSDGGGIYAWNGETVTITNSIVACNLRTINTEPPVADDLAGGGTLSVHFSLIGTNTGTALVEAPVGLPDANGNLIGGPVHGIIDPLLGPLTYNGGLTMPDGSRMLAYALLPGSPAINAGDPAAVAGMNGVPLFDQRGDPWSRVVGGRLDIGAVESQPNPLPCDYNFDGIVDTADYTVYRDALGSTTDLRADGNGNGRVDQTDCDLWKTHFGQTLSGSGVGSGSGATAALQSVAADDGVTASQSPTLPADDAALALAVSSAPARFWEMPGADQPLKLAIASTLSDAAATAVRHDSALLAWLASQTLGKPDHDDADLIGCVGDQAAKASADSTFEAVDDVFETLSSSV